MNRRLTDASMAEVNRQLAYKSQWMGRDFALVPPNAPTARVCNRCGYKMDASEDDMRPTWHCPSCGKDNDRKVNGAMNVLDAGRDMIAGTSDAWVTRELQAQEKRRRERDEDAEEGASEV